MNAKTHHIDLLLDLKKELFNYKDSLNELLIRSGQRLMEGYTLNFPDNSGIYVNNNQWAVNLHSIHRYLYNCPGLGLFGPNKYWAEGDKYLFIVKPENKDLSFETVITLKEPFKDLIVLPFEVTGSWSLTLKLIEFGGSNQKAWQQYLDADYDSRAIHLLNKLPKDFGLPLFLRDYEFLQRIASVYSQNKDPKPANLINKIIRNQIPYYRKQLLDQQYKIAIFDQQKGLPLVYEFTDFSEFKPLFKLKFKTKIKIYINLWNSFFTI